MSTRGPNLSVIDTGPGRRVRAAERAELQRAERRAAGQCITCAQPSPTYRCAPCRAIADANVERYRGRGIPGRQPNAVMDRDDLAKAIEALGQGLRLTLAIPTESKGRRAEADHHELERLSQAVLGVRFALLVLRRNAKRLPIALEDLLDDDDLDEPTDRRDAPRQVSRTPARVRETAPAEVSAPFARGAETAPAPKISEPDAYGSEIPTQREVNAARAPHREHRARQMPAHVVCSVCSQLGHNARSHRRDVSTTPAPVVETGPAADGPWDPEAFADLAGLSRPDVSATPAAVAETSPVAEVSDSPALESETTTGRSNRSPHAVTSAPLPDWCEP